MKKQKTLKDLPLDLRVKARESELEKYQQGLSASVQIIERFMSDAIRGLRYDQVAIERLHKRILDASISLAEYISTPNDKNVRSIGNYIIGTLHGLQLRTEELKTAIKNCKTNSPMFP